MPAGAIGNGGIFRNDMAVLSAILMQAPDKIARRGMSGGKQPCNQKSGQNRSYAVFYIHHVLNLPLNVAVVYIFQLHSNIVNGRVGNELVDPSGLR